MESAGGEDNRRRTRSQTRGSAPTPPTPVHEPRGRKRTRKDVTPATDATPPKADEAKNTSVEAPKDNETTTAPETPKKAKIEAVASTAETKTQIKETAAPANDTKSADSSSKTAKAASAADDVNNVVKDDKQGTTTNDNKADLQSKAESSKQQEKMDVVKDVIHTTSGAQEKKASDKAETTKDEKKQKSDDKLPATPAEKKPDADVKKAKTPEAAGVVDEPKDAPKKGSEESGTSKKSAGTDCQKQADVQDKVQPGLTQEAQKKDSSCSNNNKKEEKEATTEEDKSAAPTQQVSHKVDNVNNAKTSDTTTGATGNGQMDGPKKSSEADNNKSGSVNDGPTKKPDVHVKMAGDSSPAKDKNAVTAAGADGEKKVVSGGATVTPGDGAPTSKSVDTSVEASVNKTKTPEGAEKKDTGVVGMVV